MTNRLTSALAVANWFINKNKKDKPTAKLDHLKLQKLVFFAHAWHLALDKGPLFEDDIHAWKHGPVIPNLWDQFKYAGRKEISELGEDIFAGLVDEHSSQYPLPPEDVANYLERIWEVYKNYSGIQLSNATHNEGEPWEIVAKKLNYDFPNNQVIPNEIIESAYKKKLKNS